MRRAWAPRSYYTVFSLAPMLLVVIGVVGLVFGRDAARGGLFEQISGLMGADAAKAVQGILASASKPSEGILGTVIGAVMLLIGATTVIGELQDALDRIWRSPAMANGAGLWGLLRTRFLSFEMAFDRQVHPFRWNSERTEAVATLIGAALSVSGDSGLASFTLRVATRLTTSRRHAAGASLGSLRACQIVPPATRHAGRRAG